MSARLHRKTPSINAVDGRGLPVRQVAYCRGKEGEKPQMRASRQEYDVAGRLIAQRDPRLANATDANLATVYSLSGKPLRVNSVDAGWRLNLPGDAGQILRSWDQRGNHWQSTYDNQLRLITVEEQAAGKELRKVECLSYGDSSQESAALNQCGALIRHDDSAGTLIVDEYALCGKPLGQTRHMLIEAAQPDWPTDLNDRGGLLEKGEGYKTSWSYDALGHIIQQTDAARHEQHYTFDVAGQLKSASLKIKGTEAKNDRREPRLQRIRPSRIANRRQWCNESRDVRSSQRATDVAQRIGAWQNLTRPPLHLRRRGERVANYRQRPTGAFQQQSTGKTRQHLYL